MTHDTTKDPRILVAHLASLMLNKLVKQKPVVQLKVSRDRLVELASACESAVMILMYMYQEPAALATAAPLLSLEETVKALADAYDRLLAAKDDATLLRANIRWSLRTLKGLRQRLNNSGATLAAGIDLLAVQVRNVAKMSGFLKTRVTDGIADYSVITNLTNVETNSTLAVAFLPPREIGAAVSEAMFLGSSKRSETPGTVLNEEQVDAREAAAILYELIARHPK